MLAEESSRVLFRPDRGEIVAWVVEGMLLGCLPAEGDRG